MSGTVIRWCTCPLVVSAVAGLSTQRALIDPEAAKIRVRHAQFTASAGPDAFLCIRSSQDRGRTWSGIRVCPAWSWDCSGWEERDGTGPEWRRGWTGIFRPNCKFWNQIGGANPALRAALLHYQQDAATVWQSLGRCCPTKGGQNLLWKARLLRDGWMPLYTPHSDLDPVCFHPLLSGRPIIRNQHAVFCRLTGLLAGMLSPFVWASMLQS